MYCTFWFCSNFPLETSDCILHRSYVCKLKVDPSFQDRKGLYIFSVQVLFYLLFSHELRWEMRLRNTPRCKSDDKRYSLDFEHQETIYRLISLPVLQQVLARRTVECPLGVMGSCGCFGGALVRGAERNILLSFRPK